MKILLMVKTKRMDKLEYIPGDLVYIHGNLRTIINCDGYYATYYDEDEFLQEINVNVIKPISLTSAILEKNGWNKDNSKFCEYDDDPEYENRYFNCTYDLTLDLDDCSVYKGTSGILYSLLSEVKYVHQLQHLLFGLDINHEMGI